MPTFVAVDTGGTFTDLVALNPQSGALRYTKTLTTHDNPIDGILTCVDKAGISLADASVFKHGTTLVINTLLERSGPNIALVTTAGFRDVIELGRGGRTEPFNLTFRREPPLVARSQRFELPERMNADGTSKIAPTRKATAALALRIAESAVEAVAISFLNAYRNPSHERQVAAWLREMMPGCYITCAADLSREWNEYERTVTAAANAYAGPKAGHYFASLSQSLAKRAFSGDLYLMSSSGGVLSAAQASAAPVLLVESGPVGGCIGASVFAERLGLKKIIAFDMGGTTAKCSLVEEGHFAIDSTYYIGGYGRGMPIRAPVLDIVEIGAGGGSIAWVDNQGGLHVGPQSAGSMPGPVAYGRGGTQPTVTDANLLLSRINGANFQGGEMTLDLDGSHAAMSAMAVKLGYDGADGVTVLASGILAIANIAMVGAIKRITVERGKDPRAFVLFAYGGGGPLHGADLARSLNIPTVIIPPEPGNFSAIGMLLADLRRDAGRTFVRRVDEHLFMAMEQAFALMESELRHDAFGEFNDVDVNIVFERHAELRFIGQSHAVKIDITGVSELADLRVRFSEHYVARFGHVNERGATEVIALHSVASARIPRPDIAQLARKIEARPGAAAMRSTFFASLGRAVDTAVYSRWNLPLGWSGHGPAVIEEYGSTTIVGPHDDFEIGQLGEITIHIDRRAGREDGVT
jgi:N-methylhydantoinase A